MTDRPASSPSLRDDELRRRHLEVYGHHPLRPMEVHQLEPRLLSGRQPLSELDARQLADHGVTHVLDLRQEREWKGTGRQGAAAVAALAELGVERLALPIADGEAPDPATLDLAVDFIARAIGEEDSTGCVYVHCRAGIERTGTILLAYLARRDRQSVARTLESLTDPDRPYAPLPWQIDAVRRWVGDATAAEP